MRIILKCIKIFAITISVLWLALYIFYRLVYVPPVLMYHNVDENSKTSKLSVSPESFENQMKFLRMFRYNIISVNDIAGYLRKGKRPPFRTVAITFDDGRLNNYVHAFPIIKKYKIPCVVYISPGLVGQEGYMSWDQIKEMHQAGVHFGSHTISHAWLPGLAPDAALTEIRESKHMIEEKLKTQIDMFSYCAGGFTDGIKRAVKNSGYRSAVATSPGKKYDSNDPYAIKRIRISNSSDNLFVYFIESSGIYQFVKETRDDD